MYTNADEYHGPGRYDGRGVTPSSAAVLAKAAEILRAGGTARIIVRPEGDEGQRSRLLWALQSLAGSGRDIFYDSTNEGVQKIVIREGGFPPVHREPIGRGWGICLPMMTLELLADLDTEAARFA